MPLVPVIAGMVQVPAGGVTITDPGVAYIRSDGNDTTGNGSPSKPYLTLAPAVTAGFLNFDIGEGVTVGDITYSDNTDRSLVLCGRGSASVVGNISNNGGGSLTILITELLVGTITTRPPKAADTQNGVAAGGIIINGIASATIQNLISTGGAGGDGDGGTPGGNGGDAGSIEVYGPVSITNAITMLGGAGGADGGGGAGVAGADGSLLLSQCPSVPTPNPDSITVTGAIVAGVFYTNTYP